MKLLKMKKIVGALALSSLSAAAFAAPVNGSFSAGGGNISQVGGTTDIVVDYDSNTINWDSFNVGAGESVNFGKSIASDVQVINIDNQGAASQILGAMNSASGVDAILLNKDGINVQGATLNGRVSLVTGNDNSVYYIDGAGINRTDGFQYTLSVNPLTIVDSNVLTEDLFNKEPVYASSSLSVENSNIVGGVNMFGETLNIVDSSISASNGGFLGGNAVNIERSAIDFESNLGMIDGMDLLVITGSDIKSGWLTSGGNLTINDSIIKTAAIGSAGDISIANSAITSDLNGSPYELAIEARNLTLKNTDIETSAIAIDLTNGDLLATNVNIIFPTPQGDNNNAGFAVTADNVGFEGSTLIHTNGGLYSPNATGLPDGTNIFTGQNYAASYISVNGGSVNYSGVINDGTGVVPVTAPVPEPAPAPVPVIDTEPAPEPTPAPVVDHVANTAPAAVNVVSEGVRSAASNKSELSVMKITYSDDVETVEIDGDLILIPSHKSESGNIDSSSLSSSVTIEEEV